MSVDQQTRPLLQVNPRSTLARRSKRFARFVMYLAIRRGVADFARNLLFVFLPFKLQFMTAVFYRHATRRGDLDGHFQFFCGRKIRDRLRWVLASPRTDKYINELIILLLVAGQEKLVLTLFPKIDWQNADDSLLTALVKLTTRLTSGYSIELLAQVHLFKWCVFFVCFLFC